MASEAVGQSVSLNTPAAPPANAANAANGATKVTNETNNATEQTTWVSCIWARVSACFTWIYDTVASCVRFPCTVWNWLCGSETETTVKTDAAAKPAASAAGEAAPPKSTETNESNAK